MLCLNAISGLCLCFPFANQCASSGSVGPRYKGDCPISYTHSFVFLVFLYYPVDSSNGSGHGGAAIFLPSFANQQNQLTIHPWPNPYIEGFLPKGPYLPCVSMAGRALLAGYPRYDPITYIPIAVAQLVLYVYCIRRKINLILSYP